MTKVLIGCPTHICKSYALLPWLDSIAAFTYRPLECLIVDNSPDPLNALHISREARAHGVPYPVRVVWLRDVDFAGADGNSNLRIAASMEYIRKTFITGDYDFWMNVEADIIAPPSAIEFMVERMTQIYSKDHEGTLRGTSFIHNPDQGADWLAAPYKQRDGVNWIFSCFGFTLFSRALFDTSNGGIDFVGAPMQISTDGWLRYSKAMNAHKFNFVDLDMHDLTLAHLEEPPGTDYPW